MDEIPPIGAEVLQDAALQTRFNLPKITKDYYVTLLLYLLRNVEGLHFKGGSALQKIFLDYSRLS